MTIRAWVVGLNESAILGDGWYDRAPDWFGLPFRESFPTATLRLPGVAPGSRIRILAGSYLSLFQGRQQLKIRIGKEIWRKELKNPMSKGGWQIVSVSVPGHFEGDSIQILQLETERWQHGTYEPVCDYREVGIILGAVFVINSEEPYFHDGIR